MLTRSRASIMIVLLMSVLLTVFAQPSRAQTGFTRNDGFNFRGLHALKIAGTYLTPTGTLETATDWRQFDVYVRPGYVFAGSWYVMAIWIDWNGGTAWGPEMNTPQVASHTFPQPANGVSATYNIAVRLKIGSQLGGQTPPYYKSFTIPVTVLAAPRVWATPSGDGLVQLKNEDCTYKSPVLMVEGIDQTNTTSADTYYLLCKSLVDALTTQGYAVFFLNFHDANRDMRDNATVIRQALDQVHQQCPNSRIAIAGMSMGGAVTRYALAQSEAQGIDHNVGLFISYDSPQQKAHASPELQDWLHLQNSSYPAVAALQAKLQTVAAKEMLGYATYDPSGVLHTQFYNEMNALNGNGYPHLSYNAAISNGTMKAAWGSDQVGRILGDLKIGKGDTQPLVYSITAVPGDVQPGSTQVNLASTNYGMIYNNSLLQFIGLPTNLWWIFTISFNPVYIPTASALDLQEPIVFNTSGDIVSHAGSKFDDIFWQSLPAQRPYGLAHNAVSPESQAKILALLGRTQNCVVNYSLPNGLTTPPDTYAMNVLTGVLVNVQPKTLTVNGRPVMYVFDHWEDGVRDNPRKFNSIHDVVHTATMVPLFGDETARWKHDWIQNQYALFPSIEIDANGAGYVFFANQSDFTMRLGQQTSSCAWSFADVDRSTPYGFGGFQAMSTNLQGAQGFAYLRKVDPTTYKLRYLRSTPYPGGGRSWSVPRDLTDAASGPVAIKLDAAGTAHIAFTRVGGPFVSAGLWYAAVTSAGTLQSLEFVSGLAWAGSNAVSLVLDSQGRPVVAFSTSTGVNGTGGSAGLGVARRISGAWTYFGPSQLAESSGGWGCALALDAADEPRVSHLYAAGATSMLHYTRWSNATSAWKDTVFSTNTVPVTAGTTAITLGGPDAAPRIALWSSGYTLSLLWQNTKWGFGSIDVPGSSVSYLTMASDVGGNPTVAYTRAGLVSVAHGVIGATADVTGPGTVSNLSITPGKTTAAAFWTATGDDGNVGTAANYDIRYSSSPITNDTQFYAATPVTDIPCPSAAGSFECASVSGLTPGVGVYVALKVRDGNGTWSPMSNLAYAVTKVAGPEIMCELGGEMALAQQDLQEEIVDTPLAFALGSENPTRGPVSIDFAIPNAMAGESFDVSVFDAMGRRVQTLASGKARPGRNPLAWDLRHSDGAPARGGVYFLRMKLGTESRTRTLVVVR